MVPQPRRKRDEFKRKSSECRWHADACDRRSQVFLPATSHWDRHFDPGDDRRVDSFPTVLVGRNPARRTYPPSSCLFGWVLGHQSGG